jgi:hypothetical protein
VNQPIPEAPTRMARRQKPPRAPLMALLLLIVLAAAFAGYHFVSQPRLDLTNRLAAPVRLAIDTREAAVVPAAQSLRLTVPRGKTLVAMWELVRPLSADGRPMGEEVRGSVVEPNVSGTMSRSAGPRGANGDYFAPLITNATSDLLRITVNAGLEGAVDCRCAVRPGARRVFIGYYRLYRNSTVQAKSPDGRTALFRDLGPNVVAPDGALGLRFESKDLGSFPAAR